MSDLIKREDAIKALYKYSFVSKDVIEREINAIPSTDKTQDDEFKSFDKESLILLIEVQKERIGELLAGRPQGKWIETAIGTMCSNCYRYPYDDGEYHIANWSSAFCPHCGADMRGANK